MNREEALEMLVQNLNRWPTSVNGTNLPMGWGWKQLIHEIVLTNTFETLEITEQDWLHATGKIVKPVPATDTPETMSFIASSMTRNEWRGFCIGNSLKCRLEAKNQENLNDAEAYESMFKQYEGLNRAKR